MKLSDLFKVLVPVVGTLLAAFAPYIQGVIVAHPQVSAVLAGISSLIAMFIAPPTSGPQAQK